MVIDFIFSPAFGNRPSHLVGREPILRAFESALRSKPGSKDRAIVVLGQRGSGKTVLLWEFADRARQQGYVVASPTIASEGMLERVVEKVQDDGEKYVHNKTSYVSGGSVGALGFSAGLQFTRDVQESKTFEYKLASLARRLSERGRGIVILIDELQASSTEIRQLVIAYQELVGEGLDVALVMAGLPGAVSATLNDKVLTFLNRARKVELPPLARGDVDAFFLQAFDELGVAIAPDLRHEASNAVQGSPYMLQLVGHYICAYARDSGKVERKELDAAIDEARAYFRMDVCETTLAALSHRDADFLAAMAEDEGPSAIADVATRMGVSQDYAQKYRRRLIDAGVIEAARRGKIAFAVPYLGGYLKNG